MRNKNFAAAAIFALVLSTFTAALPTSAATVHPTFEVGISNNQNALQLNVHASVRGVSFSYLVGGVPAATFSPGVRSTTGMGLYILKVASAVTETIFVRGSDPGSPSGYIAQDTGISNTQVTSMGGNSNFGAVLNPRNSLGGAYNGLAVACVPLTYNPTGSAPTDIWHCSESFTWPSYNNTGYSNALASTTWEQNSVFGAIGTTNSSTISITADVSNGATWFPVGLGGISASLIVDSEWDLNNASAASASSAASGLSYSDSSGNVVVKITANTKMYLIDQTSGARTSRLDFYFGEERVGNTSITIEFPAGSLTRTGQEPTIDLGTAYNNATSLGSGFYYRFGWQLMGGGGNLNPPVINRPGSSAAKYSGPEILAVDDSRPMVAGGNVTFTGKNLSAVISATIGSLPATLSYDVTTGLTVVTPPTLAPGKHDLVMKSSYGTLTHINAVTIKAPTPTVTIGFRSEDAHLDEQQVLDLVAFNQKLNADYEKVRCIVNSADPKVAKRISDLVCAHVARGEARNVEVIKELRDSYPGEGFWVRVYAAG